MLSGVSVSIEEIDSINRGIIDIVSGFVCSQSFDRLTGLKTLLIRSDKDEIFLLSNNGESILNDNIIFTLGNLGFFNKPKKIYVKNINDFYDIFRDAAKHNRFLDCIYNRLTRELNYVRLSSTDIAISSESKISNSDSLHQNTLSHIPLPLKIYFIGDFTKNQKVCFQLAAERWGEIIHNNLPIVRLHGEIIEGVLIYAVAVALDGESKILAQSSPLHLRKETLLPATGIIEFDKDDLSRIEDSGNLVSLIFHEIGHILGFGSLWEKKGLVQGLGTSNPIYIGKNAMREYAKLVGYDFPIPIPIENSGEKGSLYGHWRESILGSEIMTSYLGKEYNPISNITLAAMEDIGYSVNYSAGDSVLLASTDNYNKDGNRKDKRCCRFFKRDFIFV
ncbi:hypothetical protein AM10699_16800 [Acaryochloris marina MBIC10699]|nr:hypothetical protein AM10699_16800 [Acaryochloris marina MBIC10699]